MEDLYVLKLASATSKLASQRLVIYRPLVISKRHVSHNS